MKVLRDFDILAPSTVRKPRAKILVGGGSRRAPARLGQKQRAEIKNIFGR